MEQDNCTVRDVAQLAGVSVATVSRVLSGANPVRPETKQRVLNAVSRYGYQPNASAVQMARRAAEVRKQRSSK